MYCSSLVFAVVMTYLFTLYESVRLLDAWIVSFFYNGS